MAALLELDGLTKRYGDIRALDGCSLTVDRGQMLGFLGPNGAGKTTTMRAVLGVTAVDAGTMRWAGEPLGPEHRRRIGYLPQERGLYPRMRVAEQVAYFGRLAGLSAIDAADAAARLLDRVELTDRADSLIQELSTGNQQRVQLASALVHEPELLVLDEPFAGLDPIGVAAMQEILVERAAAGAAVVFSSHQLDLVQDLCRDVSIIAAGRTVAAGTVTDLRRRSAHRRLRIDFADPTETSEVHDLDAGDDPWPLLDAARSRGSVAGFQFDPPGLDELFAELVGRGEAVRP